MNRYFQTFCILLILLAGCTEEALGFGQDNAQDEALRALRANDFESAIRICLARLQSDPDNYDLNFLLSRGYAYSGKWTEALGVLNTLAKSHPGNTDVLLFRARVESWKKNYGEAERGYSEVLDIHPGNPEALVGLAEVASWQGRYAEAISTYEQAQAGDPGNPDIHFRIGRVCRWSGNYDKARQNFRAALRLDPQNADYRRALKTASPRFQDQFELRYEHQVENFSDGRGRYLDQRLALRVRLRPLGPLILKANQTTRFDERDQLFEVEFYPRLWTKAYAYIDAGFSPKAVHFPELSYLAEIYQGLLSSAEISLGYRRMNFSEAPVSVYLGSVGYYAGQYYPYIRWYYTPEERGNAFSWTVNLRRYFSEVSYLYIGYGRGSRPFDIVTGEDLLVEKSSVLLAGFDWYVLDRIKLQFVYSLKDEGDLRRSTLFLSTGYRW
jgi:YaiO family outer membrane protein